MALKEEIKRNERLLQNNQKLKMVSQEAMRINHLLLKAVRNVKVSRREAPTEREEKKPSDEELESLSCSGVPHGSNKRNFLEENQKKREKNGCSWFRTNEKEKEDESGIVKFRVKGNIGRKIESSSMIHAERESHRKIRRERGKLVQKSQNEKETLFKMQRELETNEKINSNSNHFFIRNGWRLPKGRSISL